MQLSKKPTDRQALARKAALDEKARDRLQRRDSYRPQTVEVGDPYARALRILKSR